MGQGNGKTSTAASAFPSWATTPTLQAEYTSQVNQGMPAPDSVAQLNSNQQYISQFGGTSLGTPAAAPATTSSASSHGNSSSGYTSAQLTAMIGQPVGTVAKGVAGQGQNNGNKPVAGDPIETTTGATAANDLENYGSTLAPHTSSWDNFMSTIIPIGTAAGLGAVAAPALIGSLGSVGGAAAAGGISGADQAALTGQNVAKGALVGAAAGAVGSAAKPLTGALSTATGLSPGVSSALVKGAAGAATGALTSGLSGGNVGTGALLGGVSGAATSGLTSATGLPTGIIKPFVGLGVGALGAAVAGSSTQGNTMAGVSPSTGTNISGIGTANTQPITGSSAASPYDFSSTGSTLGSLLGPALTTAAGVYGAQNAAEDQTSAISNAIGTQQQTQGTINGVNSTALAGVTGANSTALNNVTGANTAAMGNISSLFAPQTTTGNDAFNTLGSTLGLNGQPANYSNFTNMPGYQFAVQQGTQAINHAATAGGNAYTPGTMAAVGQYVTGTAAQDYNTYVGQLMSAAGYGASANNTLAGAQLQTTGNVGQANLTTAGNVGNANLTTAGNLTSSNLTTGTNTSQLQQNMGNAQASGVSGSAGAISSLLGNPATTGAISSLLGNGSSSGTPTASQIPGFTSGLTADGALNAPVTSGDISNLTSGAATLAPTDYLSGMQTPTANIPDDSDEFDWLSGSSF